MRSSVFRPVKDGDNSTPPERPFFRRGANRQIVGSLRFRFFFMCWGDVGRDDARASNGGRGIDGRIGGAWVRSGSGPFKHSELAMVGRERLARPVGDGPFLKRLLAAGSCPARSMRYMETGLRARASPASITVNPPWAAQSFGRLGRRECVPRLRLKVAAASSMNHRFCSNLTGRFAVVELY